MYVIAELNVYEEIDPLSILPFASGSGALHETTKITGSLSHLRKQQLCIQTQ